MKNLTIALLALSLTTTVWASPVTTDYISAPDGLTVVVGKRTYSVPSSPQTATAALVDTTSAQSLTQKTFDHTSNVQHRVSGTYDFAASGGAVGSYPLGMTVPANALITNAILDVITAPGTSTGSPTIAIGSQTAGDILAATTNTNLSAGLSIGKEGVGSSQAIILASALRVSAASAVSLVIASNPISVGKIKVFLDYVDEN